MAIEAHSGTERRGKGFPYVIHPFEAASIVANITSDPEMLAAAVLHDVVEDTAVTIEQIREAFGNRVAHLVQTDTAPMPEGTPWRAKKQSQMDQIAHSDRDSKIVAMGDKLSNLRAIAADHAAIGDKLWERFHAPEGMKDIEWYYRGLAASLFELSETQPFQEYVFLLDKTFGSRQFDDVHTINIADYAESGGGYFATSYNSKDGATMVKFYNSNIPVDVPRRELQSAYTVYKMGLPTPMPGRLLFDGERYGAEFRRIAPKESFARYVSNRPDRYEEIAVRFARMCRKLHSTPCDTTLFDSEKEHMLAVLDRCPHLTETEKNRFRTLIAEMPDTHTCLHGDMHIGNVITTALNDSTSTPTQQQDFWIDLGDFRWGNPEFDLGMFYLTCKGDEPEMSEHLFHLRQEQMRQIWDVFVREYYGNISEAELANIEKRLRLFMALKLVYFGTMDKMRPEMLASIRAALAC